MLKGNDLNNAFQGVAFWLMMNDTPEKRWKVEKALAILPEENTGYEGGFERFMTQIDEMQDLYKRLAAAIQKEENGTR